MERVTDYVDKHLPKPRGVCAHGGSIFGYIHLYFYVVFFKLVSEQRERIVYKVVNSDQSGQVWVLAGEGEEVSNYPGNAIPLLNDTIQHLLLGLVARHAIVFEQLGEVIMALSGL